MSKVLSNTRSQSYFTCNHCSNSQYLFSTILEMLNIMILSAAYHQITAQDSQLGFIWLICSWNRTRTCIWLMSVLNSSLPEDLAEKISIKWLWAGDTLPTDSHWSVAFVMQWKRWHETYKSFGEVFALIQECNLSGPWLLCGRKKKKSLLLLRWQDGMQHQRASSATNSLCTWGRWAYWRFLSLPVSSIVSASSPDSY